MEIFATKMVEIGSDEFPFRLEMFFKNNAEIDMRALMDADLGDFTPEDLLYEFYTRTTAEIADMKRDRRLLEARNPQTFKDIIVKREECAVLQSRIVNMEKELQDLRERSRLVKEIRRLTQCKEARQHPPGSTELIKCGTLPDIHRRRRVQVLRVHDTAAPPQRRGCPSGLARDSHSTPSLPSINRPQQQPMYKYVNEKAVFCGQRGVNKANQFTLENKRVKSLTNATERRPGCSPMKTDQVLPNIRRRNVPGYCRAYN